jgi:hypothetical protein
VLIFSDIGVLRKIPVSPPRKNRDLSRFFCVQIFCPSLLEGKKFEHKKGIMRMHDAFFLEAPPF